MIRLLRLISLAGVQKGRFHITVDFIGNVFRASTAGSSPRNSYIMDLFYGLVGYVSCAHAVLLRARPNTTQVALPIWRHSVDSTVRGHRQEHQEYLKQKGIIG